MGARTARPWALLLVPLLAGCVPTPEPEDPSRFLRLDASGQPAATGAPHRCVHDRRSELTWTVPWAGDAWLDPGHRFSWFSRDKAVHLGEPGRRAGGRCGGAACDTEAAVAAVNATGLCGHRDWRLPGHEESIMLGKRWQQHPIGLHPDLFPGATAGEIWTATTFRLYPQGAWAMDPGSGLDRVDRKHEAKPIRLVRGKFVLRKGKQAS